MMKAEIHYIIQTYKNYWTNVVYKVKSKLCTVFFDRVGEIKSIDQGDGKTSPQTSDDYLLKTEEEIVEVTIPTEGSYPAGTYKFLVGEDFIQFESSKDFYIESKDWRVFTIQQIQGDKVATIEQCRSYFRNTRYNFQYEQEPNASFCLEEYSVNTKRLEQLLTKYMYA